MKLVGTIHLDLEGPRRLKALLQKDQPSIITIEAPDGIAMEELKQKVLEKREINAGIVKNSPLSDSFKSLLLELSLVHRYELLETLKYSQQKGAELYLVDIPAMVDHFFLEFDSESLDALAQTIHPDNASFAYDQVRKRFVNASNQMYHSVDEYVAKLENVGENVQRALCGNVNLKLLNPNFQENRESYMVSQILARQPTHHFGGLAHVFDMADPYLVVPRLFERMEELDLTRMKLCEVDR